MVLVHDILYTMETWGTLLGWSFSNKSLKKSPTKLQNIPILKEMWLWPFLAVQILNQVWPLLACIQDITVTIIFLDLLKMVGKKNEKLFPQLVRIYLPWILKKKPAKKTQSEPQNFEHRSSIVLNHIFSVSAVVVFRSFSMQGNSPKSDLGRKLV